MKDIWKLSAIIKGCSVPFEKTLKFSENSSNFFKKVLKFFTKTMVFLGKLLVFLKKCPCLFGGTCERTCKTCSLTG